MLASVDLLEGLIGAAWDEHLHKGTWASSSLFLINICPCPFSGSGVLWQGSLRATTAKKEPS